MRLGCPGLVQYLLETGWLSRAALVRSAFEVVPVGRRNNNFRVTGGGARLFVKQVQRPEPSAWYTVCREGLLYREIATRHELTALRPLVPRFLAWDAEAGIVITELLQESRTLLAHQGAAESLEPETFALLGGHLASVHEAWSALARVEGVRNNVSGRPPWMLELGHDPTGFLQTGGSEASRFLSLLSRCPVLQPVLQFGFASWSVDSFIHGDLRWDNILVPERGGGPVFADWELFDTGDSAWDVAAVLKDLLLLRHFRSRPVPTAEPAIDAMVRAYLAARPQLLSSYDRWRERIVAFALAHLCVSAFEHLAVHPDDTRDAQRLLGDAAALARAPDSLFALIPDARPPRS